MLFKSWYNSDTSLISKEVINYYIQIGKKVSILISPDGKVSTKDTDVNYALSPVQTGKFIISDVAAQFIKEKLNDNNANNLFKFIPKSLRVLCQDRKLTPTKASIFKSFLLKG